MDLRPGYTELPPPPVLRSAVSCLWVQVAAAAGTITDVLPDGCADVIWAAGAGAHVAGPDTGPVTVDLPPGGVLLGARFLPGAAGPALGIGLDELADCRVALPDVVAVLPPGLDGEATPEVALARLTALVGDLVIDRPPDPVVREASRRLGRPGAKVDEVAVELGLSTRSLRRRCQVAAGYGPKTLQRVLRLRRLLALLRTEEPPGLALAAARAGYADQSHATRDCTALTGRTPADHARGAKGSTTLLSDTRLLGDLDVLA